MIEVEKEEEVVAPTKKRGRKDISEVKKPFDRKGDEVEGSGVVLLLALFSSWPHQLLLPPPPPFYLGGTW